MNVPKKISLINKGILHVAAKGLSQQGLIQALGPVYMDMGDPR